jgi:hypothetical protein
MSPFHDQAPATLGDGHRTAPAWHKQQAPLDIEGMCCMARNAVHIAVECAGDEAKDALTLRSARYNLARDLPLTSAHQVALAAQMRKLAQVLEQACQGLISFEAACAQAYLPELPAFVIDPTIGILNWEPKGPTKWAPRSFGWDEGREHA